MIGKADVSFAPVASFCRFIFVRVSLSRACQPVAGSSAHPSIRPPASAHLTSRPSDHPTIRPPRLTRSVGTSLAIVPPRGTTAGAPRSGR
jgi:hypothetical protein